MEEPEDPAAGPLQWLVLAPYGRDGKLLAEALTHCGGRVFVCRDLEELLAKLRAGDADLLLISEDGLVSGGDDRLLTALRQHAPGQDDILPIVLLTVRTDGAHPITRFPGVLTIAKPTRRDLLDSVLRGAMDTRRRVLQLRTQRQDLEDRRARLQVVTNQLATRNLALADALRAKDRFLSTMSHELRTPLNAVLSYADLLALEIDGPLQEKQHKHVDRIISSARHLLAVIGQVLDYAKLNAGQLGIETTVLDLNAEVEQVVSMMLPEAQTKGLQLHVEPFPTPLPPALGDRLRVRQILLNLISNAIKFTERGEILVRFRHDREETVSVQLIDTGIGISAEKLVPLFEDFYQVDNELARAHEGSGLGLAIAKRLALLMKGGLVVSSQVGVGSVFTLSLPRAPGSDAEVPRFGVNVPIKPERRW